MTVDELRGIAVVSVQRAHILGTVDDVLVDVEAHKIGALALHGGLFRGGPEVAWSAVRKVGPSAVMVEDGATAASADKQGQLTRLTKLDALKGRQVVTTAGELIGTLDGIDFDPENGHVVYYLGNAPGGGMFHAAPVFRVPPEAVLGVGQELMTVDAQRAGLSGEPNSELSGEPNAGHSDEPNAG
jgi:sporulation protein YlmC with PRC-barrel domain